LYLKLLENGSETLFTLKLLLNLYLVPPKHIQVRVTALKLPTQGCLCVVAHERRLRRIVRPGTLLGHREIARFSQLHLVQPQVEGRGILFFIRVKIECARKLSRPVDHIRTITGLAGCRIFAL